MKLDCIFVSSSFRIAQRTDESEGRLLTEGALSMQVARKFMIDGDVQGVGYRFFAQRVAARHQVTGYVRNLADGRVEVVAEGTRESLEGFKHDLAAGPGYGRVEHVEELNLEPTGAYKSFLIER